MNAEDHFPWTPLVVSIAASLITALIIQLGGAIWWGSKIEATQTIHGNDISDLKIRMVALTEGGSKQDTILDQRIKSFLRKIIQRLSMAKVTKIKFMRASVNCVSNLKPRIQNLTAKSCKNVWRNFPAEWQ